MAATVNPPNPKERFFTAMSWLFSATLLILASYFIIQFITVLMGYEITDPLGIYTGFVNIWGWNLLTVIWFFSTIGMKLFYPKDILARILPDIILFSVLLLMISTFLGILGDNSNMSRWTGLLLVTYLGTTLTWTLIGIGATFSLMLLFYPNVLSKIGVNVNPYLTLRTRVLPVLQHRANNINITLPKFAPKEVKPKPVKLPKEPSPFQAIYENLPPIMPKIGTVDKVDLTALHAIQKRHQEDHEDTMIRVDMKAAKLPDKIIVPKVVPPKFEDVVQQNSNEIKKKPVQVMTEIDTAMPPVVRDIIKTKSSPTQFETNSIPTDKDFNIEDSDDIMNALVTKSNHRPTNPVAAAMYDLGLRVNDVKTLDGLRISRYIFSSEKPIDAYTKVANALAIKLKVQSTQLWFSEVGSGKLCLDVSKPETEWRSVLYGDIQSKLPKTKAVPNIFLGVDNMGKALTRPLLENPHLLILGTTGSGKSNLINAMTLNLLEQNSAKVINMILIDSKHSGGIYEGIPHIKGVAHDFDRIVKAFKWLEQNFNQRKKVFEHRDIEDVNNSRREKGKDPLPFIIIRIEELQSVFNENAILANMGLSTKTLESRKLADPVLEQITFFKTVVTLILTQGRQFGILLWGATQYSNISAIGKDVASQTFRIGLSMGLQDTRTAFGSTSVYPCHTLNKGEFLYGSHTIQRGIVTYMGSDKVATARELERRLDALKIN